MIFSIKSRLLIFALCISLIPISIISTVYYINAKNTLKKQTLQWLTAVAESRELHVLEFMEGKRGRTIDFGSDGFIRDSLETITQEGDQSDAVIGLNRHLKVNKKPLDHHIKAIAILDIEGNVVSSTHEPWIGEYMYREEVFSQAMGKSFGDTYVEQPQYIHYLNSDCILISAPLTSRKNNETIGVIINCYELEVLNEITANRSGMGETGEVYLVNSDKLMLTESRFIDDTPLRQMVDTEPVNKIVEYGEESSGIYLDYRGESIVGASMYISEYGWILLAEVNEAEAFAHLKRFGIFALVSGLVCAVTVVSIGIAFANSTSNPIRKLTRATKILADGDLNYRVESARKDEIGILAGSFNTMAGELKTLTENLEQRVVERTEEVEGKNVQLTKEISERKQAEELLYERTHLAELGADIGIVLTKGDTLQSILHECTEVIMRHLDVAFARIWILNKEENMLELLASAGMYTHIDGPHSRVPVGSLKIGLVAQERKPHLTNDVISDPRVSDKEWAKREGMVAFVGYPLLVEDRIVGVMAMFARKPLTKDIIDALASVANGISLGIERKQAEEQIKTSLKEKEVLLKEIHHRVKNNMQIMASLMRLQSEEIEDKQLLELFNESQNRIKSMALIHEDLYQGKDLGSIDFDQYTRKLTGRLMQSFGVDPNRIITSVNIDNVFLGVDKAIPCGLIINELFTNSLKYAFPLDKFKDKKGQIRIDCHSNSPEHTLVFSDNGVGLPGNIDIREAETMGLDLVNSLTQQLDGTIEINRNDGTEFTITFRV